MAFVGLGLLAGPATAATDAQICEAAKLEAAGKYSFCRLKAQAKAVKTGDSVDDATCQISTSGRCAAACNARGDSVKR